MPPAGGVTSSHADSSIRLSREVGSALVLAVSSSLLRGGGTYRLIEPGPRRHRGGSPPPASAAGLNGPAAIGRKPPVPQHRTAGCPGGNRRARRYGRSAATSADRRRRSKCVRGGCAVGPAMTDAGAAHGEPFAAAGPSGTRWPECRWGGRASAGSAQLRRLLPGRGIGHALSQQLSDGGISSGWESRLRACNAVRSPHPSLPKARWDTTPEASATPPAANRSAEATHGWAAQYQMRRSGRPSPTGACLVPRRRRPPAGQSCRSWRIQGASYRPQAPASGRGPDERGLYSHMIPTAFTIFPLKYYKKVTIQLRDTRICGNFSNFDGDINDLVDIYEIFVSIIPYICRFCNGPWGVAFFRRCGTIGPTDK